MVNRNELIVKDNKLIEASYRLSLVEQRIILLAITEARKTRKGINSSDLISIQARDYAEIYSVDLKHAYAHLKEAARSLFLREFTLYHRCPQTGADIPVVCRWLSAASHFDGTGLMMIMFSGVIVPYITRLETAFTKYKLEKIASMTSVHAIRLYELLIQWGSVGKREIELEWLRKALMLEDQYQAIKDFKKYVIDVAVAQINAHSDLTVEYTQRKTGRNVTHIIFAFKKKEEQKPVIEVVVSAVETKQEEDACFSTATIKISRANQAKFLKLRTPDEIRQCIAIANQNIMDVEKKGAKIRNLSAYYATAIRDGWHLEQKEQQKKQEQNNQEEVKKREQIASAIEATEAACRARGIHELNIYNRAHGIPLINL